MSYTDVIRTSRTGYVCALNIVSLLAGSLFLALMAQISIPLWFSPVPLSMQTLAVLLLGALLGAKRGALAVAAYLAEGALGLPFFAGGAAGMAALAGPTGGYFLGFILSTFLVGYLLEREGWRSYPMTIAALALGSLVILASGILWLSLFVGSGSALVMGFYPFLIGDLLKIGACATLIHNRRK
ncbi:MAG: biotin transporter BioY [Chlamydiales bacterium]|nr:biotin transporter BioY [Chlamydiales bacterium]